MSKTATAVGGKGTLVPMNEEADALAGGKSEASPSLAGQLRAIFMTPLPLKVLLLAVPVAIFAGRFELGDTVIFSACFLGLIPLAALLGDFTEDLALRSNDVVGALINVTFGNATELIISICALRAGMYQLIKLSLIGSIMGNMLLVLGSAFVVGGLRRKSLEFNCNAVNTYGPLLLLSMMSFVIPSAYSTGVLNSPAATREETHVVLSVSRQLAVIMCLTYVAYLVFQLVTHKEMFDGSAETEDGEKPVSLALNHSFVRFANYGAAGGDGTTPRRSPSAAALPAATSHGGDDDDEAEEPQFSLAVALGGMLVVSVLISILSDTLVDSLKGAAAAMSLPDEFIGIILVPIVGNAAEHASSIVMAAKGKMDIAVGVALGSSIQIGMFVMPVLVVVAWIINLPLDMNFHPYIVAVLLVSVLVANNITSDGKSNWLEGAMLIAAYLMIAIIFINGSVLI